MADIGRNDPCPCGSGKKYKYCHWGETLPGEEEPGAPGIPGPAGMSTARIVLMMLAVVLALSTLLYIAISPRAGYVFGGVSGLIILMWAAWRSPPPIRDDATDSAAINFGSTKPK